MSFFALRIIIEKHKAYVCLMSRSLLSLQNALHKQTITSITVETQGEEVDTLM